MRNGRNVQNRRDRDIRVLQRAHRGLPALTGALHEDVHGLQAVFCGHDHNNSFDGIWCGIHLAYCGSVGYHAYGIKNPGRDRECLRGGRTIDIDVRDPWRIRTDYILTRES